MLDQFQGDVIRLQSFKGSNELENSFETITVNPNCQTSIVAWDAVGQV